MTREEAIEILKNPNEMYQGTDGVVGYTFNPNRRNYEAFQLAIKALEQEPCEDAISKRAVLNTLDNMDSVLDEDRTVEAYKELLTACYKDLPRVTPTKCIGTVKFSKEDMQELVNEKMKNIVVERKKGKWINKSQKSGCGITFVASECTCCGKKTLFNCDELIYKYCPNCGAEMEGEE